MPDETMTEPRIGEAAAKAAEMVCPFCLCGGVVQMTRTAYPIAHGGSRSMIFRRADDDVRGETTLEVEHESRTASPALWRSVLSFSYADGIHRWTCAGDAPASGEAP